MLADRWRLSFQRAGVHHELGVAEKVVQQVAVVVGGVLQAFGVCARRLRTKASPRCS
jgi:hypothetical protein